MLQGIIEASLRHRAVVILAVALVSAAGVASVLHLPFDAYPDTTPVQVTVNTSASTLSPLEVERQVTLPLERAISGLPNLASVRSISKFGFSQITALFEDGTDVFLARQVVSERLAAVELPGESSAPTLGPVSTGLGEVLQYLVRSDELSAQELRTLHHWVIRPQLLQVNGVAEINTWGGFETEYHIIFDPDRLYAFGLTLDEVALALRRNNANVGGGGVDLGGETQLIHGVSLATSPADLEAIVVAAVNGVPIRVRDLARVEVGHELRRGAVTAGGTGEVVLGLGFMLMGENSRALTARLEARLEEVRATLPAGAEVVPVYTRTTLVGQVLETVRRNLLEGALLVVAILFAFLGNLRAGLIVALAIPLSMLFAFSAMLRFGIAGSLMSLGAIDFGLIVDSSVIMVENAERRVAAERGRSIIEVVRDAALEVRRPTLFGELIIAIVYLPILFLEGVEGQLFRPMALTVIFALAGSMVLSITLMPVLASLVLRPRARWRENALVRGLLWVYRPFLEAALRVRWVVLGLAVLLIAQASYLATQLGSEFVPRLQEQSIVINTVRLAGVSLEESVRYGTRIEALLLREFPDEIQQVWTRTGTAEVATDPMGIEVSDVFITLTSADEWTQATDEEGLVRQMSALLNELPGMDAVFTQPIEMRLNEMSAGIRSDLGIKLFGDDFEVLRREANRIRQAVEVIPGAADVTVEQVTGQPIRRISVNREALARFGIPAESVLSVVQAVEGIEVGELVEGQMVSDVTLRLPERYRDHPEQLGQLLITAPSGQRIPLEQLVDVEVVEAPSTINHEWSRRRVVIQSNVRDRDVGSFVAEVRAAVDALGLPEGYHVRYGGQFEHLERARTRLAFVVPLALFLILALLYFTFGEVRDALLVFSGVPLAAVGGVGSLWLFQMPFSISAGVGFIAVSGVAVLGQLVLVSRIRQLRSAGTPLVEAVRRAAESRLRPVLMTALVAALGFVPMALSTGVGAEVQRPLAVVVIGGVLSSLFATLLVLPALYSVRRRREGLGEGEGENRLDGSPVDA